MPNLLKLFTKFCVLAVLAQTCAADPYTPGIDSREANQQLRIEQGIASGSLTPREARRLDAQQYRIKRAESAAKADGMVTQSERRYLQHRENQASRELYHKKHNGFHR